MSDLDQVLCPKQLTFCMFLCMHACNDGGENFFFHLFCME